MNKGYAEMLQATPKVIDCSAELARAGRGLGVKLGYFRAENGFEVEVDRKALHPSYDRQINFDRVVFINGMMDWMKNDAIVDRRWGIDVKTPSYVTLLTNEEDFDPSKVYEDIKTYFERVFSSRRITTLDELDSKTLGQVIERAITDLQGKETAFNVELGMVACAILANHQDALQAHQKAKEAYTAALKLVSEAMKEKYVGDEEVDTKVGVVRAGPVEYCLLHGNKDATLEKCLCYEAKRLPSVDGSFAVGIDDPHQVVKAERINRKVIEIDEVFLASGATIISFMLDCFAQGIKPEKMKIIAPFVDQHGAEMVHRVAEKLGWEVEIQGAKAYYNLNEKLYVLIGSEDQPVLYNLLTKLYPEKTTFMAGGDAGDQTEDTLPEVVKRLEKLGFTGQLK